MPEGESLGSHIPRSLSISLGSSPSHDETTGAGPRTQSIAEQAFTKGLERLKARTITPSGKPPSPRSSVEFVRPRTGSQASEDLEPMQGMMAGAPLGSQVPTETIREKDDVSPTSLREGFELICRLRMQKDGYMGITNGRIWALKVV
jgi:hypothetical protein